MTDVSRALWRLVLRIVVAACIALLLLLFGRTLWRLFSPFLLSIPVALMLQRPIRFVERRLHLKRGIATAVLVILFCGIVCVLLYWLLATVIGQVIQLSSNYQTIISDIISLLRSVSQSVLDALDYLPASVEAWISESLNNAFSLLGASASRMFSQLIGFTISFASSVPYALIYLNFLLLGIFFITSDFVRLKAYLERNMGESAKSRSQMLSGTAGHGMSAYVRVQFLYALLVLAVSWPCLSLFGLPYPFLIAMIAALLEFLPIFGNGTLYIPWAIICYIIGLPQLGTQMLLLHLPLFVFRKLTEPKLLSSHMGLSPLLSLIAMFVGMQLSGVLGLILAPIAVVVAQAAWHGGLFVSTIADLRTMISHIASLLRDPRPTEPKKDAPSDVPLDEPPAQETP